MTKDRVQGLIDRARKEVKRMVTHNEEYKQLSCSDFGADCDFMVRAQTTEEVMKYGHDHGCAVHGKCGFSPEGEKKMKSLIKSVQP